MIYALLDKCRIIEVMHLLAALALWKYCADSARFLFLRDFDNADAGKIFSSLCQHPKGMTRTEISNQVFKRNLIKTKMTEALSYMRRLGLGYSFEEQTDGRTVERWFLRAKDRAAKEYD
jgi:hypothetical protein